MSDTTQQAVLRAEFEGWAGTQGYGDTTRMPNGNYWASNMQALWLGYSAGARTADPDPVPVAWACTDYDGNVGIGLTREAAQRNAPAGCEHFFPLLAGVHEIDARTITTPADKWDVGLLREEVLGALDDLGDEAAAHMLPDDIERFGRTECTATAYSVRVGTPAGRSKPLFTREQVDAALTQGGGQHGQ